MYKPPDSMLAMWGVVLGVLLAVIYGGQLYVMSGQLTVMSGQLDQMRLDQRPWVQFSIDDPAPYKEGVVPAVMVQLSNSGKTPAQTIRGAVGIETVKNGDDPKLDFSDVATFGVSTGAIFPNAKAKNFQIQRVKYAQVENIMITGPPLKAIDPIEHEEFVRFTNNEEFFVLFGRVTYLDYSGTEHWTQFCVSITSQVIPGTFSAKKCTEYNAADNNH